MSNYAVKTVYSKFYDFEDTTKENVFRDTRNIELGILGGIGVQYKSFLVEIRYEMGNGMAEYEYSALTSTSKSFVFLFGYRF